jgi:predicted TIM-barrel fold metal-dependent hydrolase
MTCRCRHSARGCGASGVGMAFFAKLSLNDIDKEKIAHLNAEKLLRL